VQHFEHAARQPQLTLAGLVGIGIHAKRDRFGNIGLFGQFLPQELRGIDFCVNFALEIQSRRQAEVAVRGPGKAVDAAMLAAAIRVERNAERHVGRPVASQYGFRAFLDDFCLQSRGLRIFPSSSACSACRCIFVASVMAGITGRMLCLQCGPAVIHRFTRQRLIPPLQVGNGTTALAGFQGRGMKAGDSIAGSSSDMSGSLPYICIRDVTMAGKRRKPGPGAQLSSAIFRGMWRNGWLSGRCLTLRRVHSRMIKEALSQSWLAAALRNGMRERRRRA